MGNSLTNEQLYAQTDFKMANQRIASICEAYLDFVFETSSLIDVDIAELSISLNETIDQFKECQSLKNLGCKQSSTFEIGIEEHANLQKHSIRRMFHYLHECHQYFIDILSVIIEVDYGTNAEDKSDDELLHEIRKHCQTILDTYESEIKSDPYFPSYILTNRIHRLRKLLFKDCEQLLQDFITIAVANRKEIILDNIDETLRSVLRSGIELTRDNWKEFINEIIEISENDIQSLSKLPLSNFTLIDQAVRDVQLHVRNLIRTVQISGMKERHALIQVLFENKLDEFLDQFDSSSSSLSSTAMYQIEEEHSNSSRNHNVSPVVVVGTNTNNKRKTTSKPKTSNKRSSLPAFEENTVEEDNSAAVVSVPRAKVAKNKKLVEEVEVVKEAKTSRKRK